MGLWRWDWSVLARRCWLHRRQLSQSRVEPLEVEARTSKVRSVTGFQVVLDSHNSLFLFASFTAPSLLECIYHG
jgi:hypothetical protein